LKFNKKLIFIIIISVVSVGIIFLALNYFFFHFFNQNTGKPGSCLILEQKYCKKGVVINSPWYSNDIAIAFNLPVGTKVFSPITGEVSTPIMGLEKGSTDNISSGFIIETKADDLTSEYILLMNLSQKDRFVDTKSMKQGNQLGNLNKDQISFLGKYNLILVLNKYDDNKQIISTKDMIKKLFSIKK